MKIKDSALNVHAALACLTVSSERETCNAAETISKLMDQLINRKLIGKVIKQKWQTFPNPTFSNGEFTPFVCPL